VAASGYRAVVDPDVVSLRFQALLFVTMRQEDRAPCSASRKPSPTCPMSFRPSGCSATPTTCRASLPRTSGAYQRLEDDVLAALPGVQRLNSTLVIKQVVSDRPLPIT
jgi:hypothetical protein